MARRIYLIPPTEGCSQYAALGIVGCTDTLPCRVWVTGELWATPQAYVHELGHK